MLSAAGMSRAYAAGEISPVEIARMALAAIGRDNPGVNAWVHVAADAASRDARASAARWARGTPIGPLDGVPVGVKDLLAVAGQPMRRGSPAYAADFTPTEDAPIVARLRAAGAILIGKTATPDAGCKLDTTSLVHGITRNPHDLALTAGGSSGGTAAALALGHVPIGIGTDGGGSIRVPAAFCGVFGLKPSTGRIPAPVGPFWPHAVTGPMSRTVLDTALTWNAATMPDAPGPLCHAACWHRLGRGGEARRRRPAGRLRHIVQRHRRHGRNLSSGECRRRGAGARRCHRRRGGAGLAVRPAAAVHGVLALHVCAKPGDDAGGTSGKGRPGDPGTSWRPRPASPAPNSSRR